MAAFPQWQEIYVLGLRVDCEVSFRRNKSHHAFLVGRGNKELFSNTIVRVTNAEFQLMRSCQKSAVLLEAALNFAAA